jgi:hypothetical protein
MHRPTITRDQFDLRLDVRVHRALCDIETEHLAAPQTPEWILLDHEMIFGAKRDYLVRIFKIMHRLLIK